ncbi:hypothetical protein MRB53_023107 [Persea americana]|uniref:Uncharacterized protein n=1 Tax=Persea americana TaxID=3435 RepID=A0ACC2L8H4_PERAE|nr:hypothetical protein MRB53_023107 [Persea americana]
MGELLNHAQKKLRRKMKNRESAARSRERKKAYTEQLEINIEELKKVLMAQNSFTRKKQTQPQRSLL